MIPGQETRVVPARLAAKLMLCAALVAVCADGADDTQPPSKEEWLTLALSDGSKDPRGQLLLGRFNDPTYYLLGEIAWESDDGSTAAKAPKGFVTDLASIPPVFFSVLRPDGKYAYAAVLHDYLYWTQECSRKEADRVLKKVMVSFGVRRWKRWSISRAVRTGGGIAWSANKRRKENGERRVLAKFPLDPLLTWAQWKNRPDVFVAKAEE